MNQITVGDHVYRLFIGEKEIEKRIVELAELLRQRLEGKNVVFFVILKGSLLLAADLVRSYGQPCTLEMVRAQSYRGTQSSGVVEVTMTDDIDLRDKTVVIIEDIVETGRTLQAIHHHLKQSKAREVLTLSLLRKPSAMLNPVRIDFVGFDIGPEFVVGYGMDLDEDLRYLRAIYVKVSSEAH